MVIVIHFKEVSITIILDHFIGYDASSIQFVDMFMYTYNYDWNKQEIAI